MGHGGLTLELRDVSVRFGGLEALDRVSLRAEPGQVLGLIGPNGAGKTTLLNVVSGTLRPSAGTILVDGTPVGRYGPARRAALGIARTFQAVGLVREASVAQNLLMAQHRQLGTGPVRSALGLARDPEREAAARALRALGSLGVADLATAVVKDLPHGQLKLVELAAALVRQPRLLLLDEPSAGLDPAETSLLADRLLARREAQGFTVVVVDHDMRLVRRLADTIVVLAFGRVIARGTWDEIRADPDVVRAYLGTRAGAWGAGEAVRRGAP